MITFEDLRAKGFTREQEKIVAAAIYSSFKEARHICSSKEYLKTPRRVKYHAACSVPYFIDKYLSKFTNTEKFPFVPVETKAHRCGYYYAEYVSPTARFQIKKVRKEGALPNSKCCRWTNSQQNQLILFQSDPGLPLSDRPFAIFTYAHVGLVPQFVAIGFADYDYSKWELWEAIKEHDVYELTEEISAKYGEEIKEEYIQDKSKPRLKGEHSA